MRRMLLGLAVLFNNWETFIGQAIALALVLGSYAVAQYLRVWRPRRRGLRAASVAREIPSRPADIAVRPMTNRRLAGP